MADRPKEGHALEEPLFGQQRIEELQEVLQTSRPKTGWQVHYPYVPKVLRSELGWSLADERGREIDGP